MPSEKKKANELKDLTDEDLKAQIDEEFILVDAMIGADLLGGPLEIMRAEGLNERQLMDYLMRIDVRQNELIRRKITTMPPWPGAKTMV